MRKLLIISLLIFSVIRAYSNGLDTLVYFNELTFNSLNEKKILTGYFQSSKLTYELFLPVNDSTSKNIECNRDMLNELIIELKERNVSGLKPKKQIKIIYNKVHDKLLKKYDIKSLYSDIYNTGNFNCLSASILYSLIFEEFNIPYRIKLSNHHVFLLSYPNTYSIVVETTNPMVGYQAINQNFKAKYIGYLKDSKLISLSEYNSKNTDDLFNEYYFKEKNVTLVELVGVQYYNDAIIKMENQNYEAAFHQLEKAYLFYSAEEVGYLLMTNGVAAITELGYKNLKIAHILAKLSRYNLYGIKPENIIVEFAAITQNLLNYEGNEQLYDSVYTILINNIANKEILNEINYIFHYEKGRFLTGQSKYHEILPHFEKACELKPKNAQILNMLVFGIGKRYDQLSSPDEAINLLEYYQVKFKGISQNNLFHHMLVDAYLNKIQMCFYNKEISIGNLYISKFEELFDSKVIYDQYIDYKIASAFTSAAMYYFRRGNYSKAKIIIETGLKYTPNNYELKSKLKALE